MKKIIYTMLLVLVGGLIVLPIVQGQEDEQDLVIEGKIENIVRNEGYIVVNGKFINVPEDIFEEGDFMVGDAVEIAVENTDNGFVLSDYDYIFEDDDESLDDESLYEEQIPFDFSENDFDVQKE